MLSDSDRPKLFGFSLMACLAGLIWFCWQRVMNRQALRLLHDWADAKRLAVVGVERVGWQGRPPMRAHQRAFRVYVVDATGEKRTGVAVCGREVWFTSPDVIVEWSPPPPD